MLHWIWQTRETEWGHVDQNGWISGRGSHFKIRTKSLFFMIAQNPCFSWLRISEQDDTTIFRVKKKNYLYFHVLIFLHYLEIYVLKKINIPLSFYFFSHIFCLSLLFISFFCNAKTKIKHLFCLTRNSTTQHTLRPMPTILQNHYNFKQSNTNLQNIPIIKHKWMLKPISITFFIPIQQLKIEKSKIRFSKSKNIHKIKFSK